MLTHTWGELSPTSDIIGLSFLWTAWFSSEFQTNPLWFSSTLTRLSAIQLRYTFWFEDESWGNALKCRLLHMLAGPNSIMTVHTLPLPLRESDTGCDSGHGRIIALYNCGRCWNWRIQGTNRSWSVYSIRIVICTLSIHLFLVVLAARRFASHFPHPPCCACARKWPLLHPASSDV